MTEITVEDVKRILREAAGVDESIDMGQAGVAEMTFSALGYESLAVLEFGNRIEREYGLAMPDGELGNDKTLRQVVEYVNNELTKEGRF